GVQVAGSDQWSAPVAARGAGARHGRRSVLPTLLLAHIAPATPVGDLADLLDVDVDQVAGVLVFVAAGRLAGGSVDVGQTNEPAADQDRVHRRGRHAEPVADLDRSEPLLPAQVHD